MATQIGCFFMVIGGLLIVVFYFSLGARDPAWNFCLGGLPLLLLGAWVWRRGYKPPPPNTSRFRSLRRRSDSKKEKKKES